MSCDVLFKFLSFGFYCYSCCCFFFKIIFVTWSSIDVVKFGDPVGIDREARIKEGKKTPQLRGSGRGRGGFNIAGMESGEALPASTSRGWHLYQKQCSKLQLLLNVALKVLPTKEKKRNIKLNKVKRKQLWVEKWCNIPKNSAPDNHC